MIATSIVLCLVAAVWWMLWRVRIGPCWTADVESVEGPPVTMPRISIVIPARNEARDLPNLLQDLHTQGPPDMEIIVVDDHSIDGTCACVREAARADGRVRLVRAAPKPEAWAGKNWALGQGVARATGEWLLFCDADVRLQPGALEQAVRQVEAESLDVLSLLAGMGRPRLGTSFLLACFALSRALLFRPAAPEREGLVQGAFLLVRRTAYDAVGGHAQHKELLLEDVELGRRLQAAGCRVRAWPARRWVTTRMYDTFEETQHGFEKHIFPAIGFSSWRLAWIVALHMLLFLFPAASLLLALHALVRDGPAAAVLALLAASGLCYTVMGTVAARVARAESLPLVSAWAAPVSYFWMAAAVSASVSGYRKGAISWKGRAYGGQMTGPHAR